MMNRPIQGTIVAATRKRTAFGEAVFAGVTIRRADGSEENLGQMSVPVRLADALVPGTRGQFHFHDIMGTRGLHGFRAEGGAAPRMVFPRLTERFLGLFAMLNLALALGGIALDGSLRLLPLMMGVLAVAAWATFRGSRQAIVHDFGYETGMTLKGRAMPA